MTTTRYYKVNGEYHTYEWLHDNLGYTKTATTSVTYKDATYAHFGEDADPSGYFDYTGQYYDFSGHRYFVEDEIGWHDLDALSWGLGYYPSSAVAMQVKKGNVISDAVYLEADANYIYLIREALSDGWMTYDEMTEEGWIPYEYLGEPIGGDISSTTDNIIHVNFGAELVSRGGYAYQDGNLLGMQWDLGGDVEEYTPPIVIPTLTLDLYLSSDKQARTFSAGGYGYSYFASAEDRQSALDFGLPAFGSQQLQLGGFSEGFEVVILALLDANHDVILSDTSNFYLSFMQNENGTWAVIRSIAAYSTPTVFWRLKITKPDVLTGYYKDGSSYLYWDSRRTIKIKYSNESSTYDIRTCVRATEYFDPRWADQPWYGDGTREIDPSKVSLSWYSAGSHEITPHFANDVTIKNDSVVVIEYTMCKEMYLYRYETETGWTGPDYYYQGNVTKSFTGTKQDWALGLLRTEDQGGGTTVAWDDSKRYELGSYNSSKEWVPYPVQSLSDMPDTTAGSLGEATLAYLIVNLNGYLGIWFVSNYTSAVSNSMKTFRLRIYNK